MIFSFAYKSKTQILWTFELTNIFNLIDNSDAVHVKWQK